METYDVRRKFVVHSPAFSGSKIQPSAAPPAKCVLCRAWSMRMEWSGSWRRANAPLVPVFMVTSPADQGSAHPSPVCTRAQTTEIVVCLVTNAHITSDSTATGRNSLTRTVRVRTVTVRMGQYAVPQLTALQSPAPDPRGRQVNAVQSVQ
ncbi:hypothetical protein scyTo_0022538, partial [Scyliorhinus torazame]|nr:hypothetical protein [Scyliorhinus torazame]